VFSSATLIPIYKKNGSIRPVAIGETIRRLVSKCAMNHAAAKAARLLGPLQLGVGVKNGCEAQIHCPSDRSRPEPLGGVRLL
jgi:hypothetical protein